VSFFFQLFESFLYFFNLLSSLPLFSIHSFRFFTPFLQYSDQPIFQRLPTLLYVSFTISICSTTSSIRPSPSSSSHAQNCSDRTRPTMLYPTFSALRPGSP